LRIDNPPHLEWRRAQGQEKRASQQLNKSTTSLKESHLRSALKGFTWRIVATTTTIIIAYFITGEVGLALSIGAIEFVGKIFIYYLHERIWQAIPRGGVRDFFRFRK
jgi:uncharacterized membrane protein